MARIVILNHAAQKYPQQYFVAVMADCWRESGHDVAVTDDPAAARSGDAVINHVDLTVVPPAYIDALRGCARAVNGRVDDIGKRKISEILVARNDDYDGPLIVKTDRNSSGGMERRQERQRSLVARLRMGLRNRILPWYRSGLIRTSRYPIYDSKAGVPDPVWSDRRFVVERFVPERDGDLFAIRTWLFLGDRDFHMRAFATTPIVKRKTVVRREELGSVPDQLRAKRHALGFDYGKFDYVVHDDRCILLDANRTPVANIESPRIRSIAATVAPGIDRVLEQGGAAA